LADLPIEVLSAKTAMRVTIAAADPMEDLRRLCATCTQMRTVCSDAVVGRSIPLLPVLLRYEDLIDWGLFYSFEYYTQLITKLVNVGNAEACFFAGLLAAFLEEHGSLTPRLNMLERSSEAGHVLAIDVLSLLLHRSNGGVAKDDSARWLLRKVEGNEGPPTPNAMWKSKNYAQCLEHSLARLLTSCIRESWFRFFHLSLSQCVVGNITTKEETAACLADGKDGLRGVFSVASSVGSNLSVEGSS
jgi:hypothetical protein